MARPRYESWFIQEYIVQKFKGTGPDLIPVDIDDLLLARKIQVLADGACDAIGLAFFEAGRGELKSEEWYGRQMRKINGVLKAMNGFVRAKKGEFLVESELSIADIAAGAFLGIANMAETKFGIIQWKEKYPELVKYWEELEKRQSFQKTQPYMFELTEKVA